MTQRPTREWLEALVSSALLSGCAGVAPAAAPPPASNAPTPTASAAPVASAALATSAVPATSAPGTTVGAPSEAPSAPGFELAAFEPSSCAGPVASRAEPACLDEQIAADSDDPRSNSVQNLANVRAACAVDAIVVYRVKGGKTRRGGGTPARIEQTARSGDPCAAATEKGSCESQLQNIAFPSDGGFADPDSGRTFFVVARAGKLELVSNRAQLIGLIGLVDSKQDAAALLWLDGWGAACSKIQAQGKSFVLPKLKLGLLCPPGMAHYWPLAEPIAHVPQGYEKEGNYRLQVDAHGAVKPTYLGGAAKSGAGFGVACGRRPSGMELVAAVASAECPDAHHAAAEVGAYLAECAQLEAAAVIAFELLACELSAHAAPAALIERCLSAVEDERRHTRLMTAAARRYGVEPTRPAPLTRALPTLIELARENVVEGCVRETWGALSAALQARTARDPQLAALYASIAPDELNHAELSWDIHDWLAERTDSAELLLEHARVARAELLREQADPSAAVRSLAGAPDCATARRLICELAA